MADHPEWQEAARRVAGEYQRLSYWSACLTTVLDGVEVQARSRNVFSRVSVSARAPDLAGLTIQVRERKRRAPWRLAQFVVEPSKFAEEMRAYTNDEDIARVVLSPALCQVLFEVDEYGSYDFIIARGEVRAQGRAPDAPVLVRLMRAISRLAARPRQLARQWGELAHAVGGQRPEPAAWRLTASDPIIATRNGVATTFRARIASPGAPVEPRLYTEYTCTPERPSTPFVLCARDWDGALPGDTQDAEPQPLGLAFLDPHFQHFQTQSQDLDAARQRCRDLHALVRSQARFVMVDADRVSLWVPGLVSDAEVAEAALQSAALLAGAGHWEPYR